ncbi:hypothetical protein FJZ27_01495 [Candidatus Peribacteria bacterium]|nr:hypothetical protein [Candidatus Peribacteria bacterium]
MVVESRRRYGDWESDLVVGVSAIAIFVERKSKLLRAALLSDQTAEAMTRGAREAFQKDFVAEVHEPPLR